MGDRELALAHKCTGTQTTGKPKGSVKNVERTEQYSGRRFSHSRVVSRQRKDSSRSIKSMAPKLF